MAQFKSPDTALLIGNSFKKTKKSLLMSIIVLVHKMVYNTCGVMLINYRQNWQHAIHSDSMIIQSYTIVPTNTVNEHDLQPQNQGAVI